VLSGEDCESKCGLGLRGCDAIDAIGEKSMAAAEGPLTLINVFPTAPEQQAELVEILTKASEETIRFFPGFLSASVYTGVNGTYVANSVQWRSREDFDQMLTSPEAQRHFAEVYKVATGNPQLYELASVVQGRCKSVTIYADDAAPISGWQVLEGGACRKPKETRP
jgi:quinol monooxygenase YgiN